ncbi:MAG: hypothetical protein V7767_15655, partial [Leeuwenhoekiella sp.]
LKESVKSGLGVFIEPETQFFRSPGSLAKFAFLRDQSLEAKLDTEPQFSVNKYPFQLEKIFGQETIHSSQNRILSAYIHNGNGKIGTTVVQNTYQLLLEGHTNAYQNFWAQIIESISKRSRAEITWEPEDDLTFIDEPFNFIARTAIDKPEIRNSAGKQISLQQNAEIPFLWEGKTYPQKSGWNRLMFQTDTIITYNFYVYQPGEWKSLTNQQIINRNRINLSQNNESYIKPKPLEPMNRSYLFAIFVFGMGFLWLEPRL